MPHRKTNYILLDFELAFIYFSLRAPFIPSQVEGRSLRFKKYMS
jgi:hypothetical protein